MPHTNALGNKEACQLYTLTSCPPPCRNYSHNNLAQLAGEFGIVYKGCLAGQYTDEIVAIKTLKGTGICIIITSGVI